MNFIGNSVAVQESNEPQTIDATSCACSDETDDSFDTTYGDLDEVTHPSPGYPLPEAIGTPKAKPT
jgi:hypothetical protein